MSLIRRLLASLPMGSLSLFAALFATLFAAPLTACLHPVLQAVPAGATVELPADHAPHPWAQTEWWHVHAELVEPATGEQIGVFAAFLVQRTGRDHIALLPVSAFVNPVQAAWVEIRVGDRTSTADRLNFPDLFTAGNRGPELDMHHGNWRIRYEGGALILRASAGPNQVELRLEPTRSATLPGQAGRVELVPGNAHLWYQMEGMRVRGRWQRRGPLGTQTHWVQGEGFFKHQWGRLYDPGLDGFTWISMDLPGIGELALAYLVDDGERGVPGSMAWLRPVSGAPIPLSVDKLSLEPTRSWHSRRSGATWPVGFNLSGPGISLRVEAVVDNQEIWS
ncbi:MAG: hypothetical protein GXP62_17485, partial [Oligoflexia bacterium]|nr:hypothetical protein [Oligoflexia bacterium]